MPIPETDLHLPQAPTVILELAVQSLIEKLIAAGILESKDLADMRASGLQFARDSATCDPPFVPRSVLEFEERVVDWWDRFDAPVLHANDP